MKIRAKRYIKKKDLITDERCEGIQNFNNQCTEVIMLLFYPGS